VRDPRFLFSEFLRVICIPAQSPASLPVNFFYAAEIHRQGRCIAARRALSVEHETNPPISGAWRSERSKGTIVTIGWQWRLNAYSKISLIIEFLLVNIWPDSALKEQE
jgi:hypothetical protein